VRGGGVQRRGRRRQRGGLGNVIRLQCDVGKDEVFVVVVEVGAVGAVQVFEADRDACRDQGVATVERRVDMLGEVGILGRVGGPGRNRRAVVGVRGDQLEGQGGADLHHAEIEHVAVGRGVIAQSVDLGRLAIHQQGDHVGIGGIGTGEIRDHVTGCRRRECKKLRYGKIIKMK